MLEQHQGVPPSLRFIPSGGEQPAGDLFMFTVYLLLVFSRSPNTASFKLVAFNTDRVRQPCANWEAENHMKS